MNFKKSGSISILVLVFGIIFSIGIAGLALVAVTQYTSSTRTEVFERALTIAQSGVEYYRWHLSHDQQNFTSDTGQHIINDAQGNPEGIFDISIDPPSTGSTILTITSTGWLTSYPDIKRTVKARYGVSSLAKFAFLNNSNMWFGQKITIHGKVFSNGGIRMEGTHDSTVESAKETYTCGQETGCDPAETKPGIWGGGGPQEFWRYPVAATDFNSIAVDFNKMKTTATQNNTYLPPSNTYGYHLIFNSDGTVSVRKVLAAQNKRGWSVEEGCQNLYQIINQESDVATYSLAQNPIIFVEDHVWVDGVVNGNATVVAARFPLDINKMNIWINGNIVYTAKDGTSNLGLIAQNDIYFGLSIPQIFEINAAMLAQQGKIIRHNYKYQGCSQDNEAVKQELIIYGSLISNLKPYWSYGQGEAGFGNEPTSGFSEREVIYDADLYFNPPPYFPIQGEYEFISWEES